MDLPIPKSRSGMFASLVLVACLFLFYYQTFYEFARGVYLKEYVPVGVEANTLPTGIEVVLRVPKYTSSVIPGWVYGSVENKSDEMKKINLSFMLKDENIILIPSSYQDENIFQRAISNLEILPHSTTYFRFPWSSNIANNNSVLLYVNQKEARLNRSVESMMVSSVKALRRSVLENLFMPPWANTLLPVLALVFCYFAENDVKHADKTPLRFKILFPILIYGICESFCFYFLVMWFMGQGAMWGITGILGWIILIGYHSFSQQTDADYQDD